MNWFRQNQFLGTFLAIFGVATLTALFFLWSAKSGFDDAKALFDQNATELNRLQRLNPFPNDENLKKMAAQAKDYATELNKLKDELKTRVLPVTPMAPNEFQSHLRQAIVSLGEKARANKVKLPDNFFLGFEEFSSALPDTAAAPGLGQQLAQAELLANIIIDARVDTLTSFHRVAPAEPVAAGPTPAAARRPAPAPATNAPATPPLIERTVFDVAFIATPSAARRVLDQGASINQQFCIFRTIHVLNDRDKGPPREGAATASATPPPSNAALNFIVGNEHIQAAARIEMLRFNF
ncbi:MAG: hypothetical protein ACXV8A_02075 [Chthoniobacterales bacterium]